MEKERQSSHSTDTNTKQQEEEEEKNEALALRYHNDIFQKGKLEVADEILSPDFILHNPVLPEKLRKGPEGAKKYAYAVIAAIPDRKLVHDSGTNTGSLFGKPPTGKRYVATGFIDSRMGSRKKYRI